MTKKIIIFLYLAILNVSLASFALAADCPPGVTPTNEAVCNPSPNFFTDLTKLGFADNSFKSLITFIIQAALSLVGIISIGFIIYGGYQYITSRGDEEQATAGKRTLTNAIIGLVIVILSYVLVKVVINALNGIR